MMGDGGEGGRSSCSRLQQLWVFLYDTDRSAPLPHSPGQACTHAAADSVVGLLRLADLLGLHRLTAVCARFVARHLDAVLTDAEFRYLVAENAAGIARREAVDSVPILDEVRTELRRLRAAACGGSDARVFTCGSGSGGATLLQHAAVHAEFDRRVAAL